MYKTRERNSPSKGLCVFLHLSSGPDGLSLHWNLFHLLKMTSRQTQASVRRWPEEICNSDSKITSVREKRFKYKISPRVQMWSWMIACHVNSEFPLITYLKCHGWFTHLHVAPTLMTFSFLLFLHRCTVEITCRGSRCLLIFICQTGAFSTRHTF